MKYFLLALGICLASLSFAQSTPPAKIVMKNNDSVTGKILEIVPETSVKILVYGSSELIIPYNQIAYIQFDATASAPALTEDKKSIKSAPTVQKDFYFMSVNEGVIALGVGKIGGLTMDAPVIDPNTGFVTSYTKITFPNATSYGGFYTANGVGYKGWGFAGIGIGAYGYSDDIGFEMPFMIDLRARILPSKKISPLVMTNIGIGYHKGSAGSLDFNDGAGVSIQFSPRFQAHALLAHSYVKYDGQLSASGASLGNYYYNYFGLRLGASLSF